MNPRQVRKKGSMTAKRKALVTALIETKPGDTVTDIAKRAGISREAYYKNVDLAVIVDAVKKGRRKRMRTDDLAGEAVNEAAVFLRDAQESILDRVRETGEAPSDNDIARVMQLSKHLFDIRVKTAELGLDTDRSLNSDETEAAAQEEIEIAIRIGIGVALMPAEEQGQVIEQTLAVWRKHGSIQSLAPDLPPLPEDLSGREAIDLEMEDPNPRALPPGPSPEAADLTSDGLVVAGQITSLEEPTQLDGPFGSLEPAEPL